MVRQKKNVQTLITRYIDCYVECVIFISSDVRNNWNCFSVATLIARLEVKHFKKGSERKAWERDQET